ncbi:MAG: hypothetical protein IPP78_00155 [Holophagaceae bacterium]|nr:hypothetical protein [Holophagaceae bacterium]
MGQPRGWNSSGPATGSRQGVIRAGPPEFAGPEARGRCAPPRSDTGLNSLFAALRQSAAASRPFAGMLPRLRLGDNQVGFIKGSVVVILLAGGDKKSHSLYRALSPDGNPEMATFLKVVHTLSISLHATTTS